MARTVPFLRFRYFEKNQQQEDKMKRNFREWTSSLIEQIKNDEESRRQEIERMIEENDEAVIAEAVRFENRLENTRSEE